MSFTNDPVCNPIDRIRLLTGDVDSYDEGLSDEVYIYVYKRNNNNENLSALECLRYLLAKYANYVTEKAGGLFVKESERYEQYRSLYDMYTKNPATMLLNTPKPFAGGISISDMQTNEANPDNNVIRSSPRLR